jgi:hypothetical protein
MMTAFEKTCPLCAHLANEPTIQISPTVVPPLQRSHVQKPPRSGIIDNWRWNGIAGVIILAVVIIGGLFVKLAEKQERAKATEKANKLIESLKTRYPERYFAALPDGSGRQNFGIQLRKAGIRFVDVDPGKGTANVTVGLIGILPEAAAPKVYVALYNYDGIEIGRSAVVDFISADLKQGTSQDVQDHIDLSKEGKPLVVSVDEGEQEARLEAAKKSEDLRSAVEDRHKFISLLKEAGVNSNLIISVKRGADDSELAITVANAWHYEPFQVRLQAAQTLWKGWAAIRSPNELDKARITLKDRMGNSVGGSSSLAGSLVHVDR